jgi:hypothetical protein
LILSNSSKLTDPEKYLWKTTTREMNEMKQIFCSISKLRYDNKPDYAFIRNQLYSLLLRAEELESSNTLVHSFLNFHRIKENVHRLS